MAQPGLLAARLASLSDSREGRLVAVDIMRARLLLALLVLLVSMPRASMVVSRSCWGFDVGSTRTRRGKMV